MTSKEIIRRVIRREHPPRIGLSLSAPYPNDLQVVSGVRYRPETMPQKYRTWGEYPELLQQVPGFRGEVRLDDYGNMYGRLNRTTKGECVKGALDSWENLANFRLPEPDLAYYEELRLQVENSGQYVIGILPVSAFSTLRDVRLMDNALMDTVLEPDNVREFLDKVIQLDCRICGYLKEAGVDAVMLYDDWGTQDRTFIGLGSFVELFQPVYAQICQRAHQLDMPVILHSCGKNNLLLDALVEAGIDVFQFDQPGAYPVEWLAEHYADKATFFMPVDIQTVMPTGDRGQIEAFARRMVEVFREKGASIIAKDYYPWSDICVKEEWADWAREVFVQIADNP